MHRVINRRTFIKTAALGSAGLLILKNPASVWSFQANQRLNVAHVGVGGRGGQLLGGFSGQSNTVALCDVNESKASASYKQFPDVPKFKDFRQMLDKMGKQIDAVVVATPDHTHAVASAAAIRAGKGVYTEKPLTRTVGESRALRLLAKEHKVATSMGNQGTSAGPFRRALELIRNGTLGEIKEVHVWNDQGGAGWTDAPNQEQPVPAYLDWDLWLGPARMRPFHARWLSWGMWRDFGTAQLGNWGSHTANLAFMALKVDSLWYADPATRPIIRVKAQAEQINTLSFPRWEFVTWEIPPRGDLPAINFHWHNGRGPGRPLVEEALGRPLDWGDNGAKTWADWAGCLIVGTEGKIYATGHNATFSMLPREKFQNVARDNPQTEERSAGHERDFLLACAGGKPAWANFDYAGPLNEFLQLGNVANRFEGTLEYDTLAGRIVNNDAANAVISQQMREGWSL